MRNPYNYAVNFEHIEKDTYAYYLNGYFKSYRYVVTSKQRKEIITLLSDFEDALLFPMVTKIIKIYWPIALLMYFSCIIRSYIKFKSNLKEVLVNCEKERCARKTHYEAERRSTSTRTTKDIISKFFLGFSALALTALYWFCYQKNHSAWLVFIIIFHAVGAFCAFLIGYRMVRFRMEYKGRLKRKESVKKYRI